MSRTPEGVVKDQVRAVLAAYGIVPAGSKRELMDADPTAKGWYYMPVKGVAFGVNGIPDFVGCACGKFFSVETKAPGKPMTANQEARACGIRRGGGKTFVVDGNTVLLEHWLKETVNA